MKSALRLWLVAGLVVLLFTTRSHAQAPAPGYPVAAEGYPTKLGPYGATISTRDATRLRALDADLHLLAARSDGRIVDGSLSLALGGAFITLGVFVHDPLFRTLLMLTGGVAASRGVITLVALPDAEAAAVQFTRMPMVSPGEVIARIAYGEEALARLAHQARRARLIDGSLTSLAGAAYIPLYTLLRHNGDRRWKYGDDPIDYVVIAFSGISLAAGVITLVVKSEAERTRDAYGRLRTRLISEEAARSTLLRPKLAPYASRDGAGLAASVTF